MVYMSQVSNQTSVAQQLATESSARMRILNWALDVLSSRDTLIRSGSSTLTQCLRGLDDQRGGTASCQDTIRFSFPLSGAPGRPVAGSAPAFVSSTSPTDFLFNAKGGFCNRVPLGSGGCDLSLVTRFELVGGELRIHASVYTRQRQTSNFDSALTVSTDPLVNSGNPNLRSEQRAFLEQRVVRYPISEFWSNSANARAPKCYPTPLVIPVGLTTSAGMNCGSFALRNATGARCPPGTVVGTVQPTGGTLCRPL
jgi:hypothetical protein